MAVSSNAAVVRAGTWFFLALIPLAMIVPVACVVLYWGLGIDRLGNEWLGPNFLVLMDSPPVPDRRLFGLAASLVPLAAWLYAMWRLLRLFADFARGEGLGGRAVGHLRAYALFCLAAMLSAFLLSGVMRWAAGVFSDAPLWTHLGLSSVHMVMLFTSGIIYVASHIIEEGYRYKLDAQEYV